MDRLTGATENPGTSYGYSYYAVGNRLSDGTTRYRYDASDRITASSFQYDGNGNLLSDGSATYQYDAANRLTKLVKGGVTTTYSFDGNGNLIQQKAISSMPYVCHSHVLEGTARVYRAG